jgi:hypothetical protein
VAAGAAAVSGTTLPWGGVRSACSSGHKPPLVAGVSGGGAGGHDSGTAFAGGCGGPTYAAGGCGGGGGACKALSAADTPSLRRGRGRLLTALLPPLRAVSRVGHCSLSSANGPVFGTSASVSSVPVERRRFASSGAMSWRPPGSDGSGRPAAAARAA